MKSWTFGISKRAVAALDQLTIERREGNMVTKCGENWSRAHLALGLFVLTTILVWIATGCQPPTPTPTPTSTPTPTPAPVAAVQPPVISDPKVGAPTPLKPREEVGISVDVSSATGVDLTYTWKADGGEIIRGQESPAITYLAPGGPGTYNVRVVVEWDGQSVEKAISIRVEEPTSEQTEELILEPTEEPTPTATPMPDAVVIAPVNLRSGPGKEYDPPVATLSANQVLTVTGRSDNATSWLQVNTGQMQEGWVVNRADLVTLNLPTEQIPIVATPPLPTLTPACQITEPVDGDENLGYRNIVRVTCSDVPDSLHIWILVYSHHDSSYYPQPGPLGSGSGQYEGMAYLGTETEGTGHRFDIIVALADATVSEDLQLPDGVEEKDRITVTRGLSPPEVSPPTCEITQPTDRDQDLGWENDVRAQCSGVPDSLYVCILVYSHHDSSYYPQPGPIRSGSGDYQGMAYLGTETEGTGHRFDLIVALANEAANTVLRSAATNHIGWPDLPDGVEEKTRITVRRGPSPPTCQITEPADGNENLGFENEVRAECSNVPDSLYVWVLVYSHHDFNYYPQPGGPIGNGSGQWMGMAWLGTQNEGVGHRFGIIIALADEAANTELQLAAKNYKGWSVLPDGVEEKDRITVKRGH